MTSKKLSLHWATFTKEVLMGGGEEEWEETRTAILFIADNGEGQVMSFVRNVETGEVEHAPDKGESPLASFTKSVTAMFRMGWEMHNKPTEFEIENVFAKDTPKMLKKELRIALGYSAADGENEELNDLVGAIYGMFEHASNQGKVTFEPPREDSSIQTKTDLVGSW